MEQEMVSTSVDNAPDFLQLRDKYKQELVEDTRLTKAADLAAKHVLLAIDAPDAWKRPQLEAVGRQLRHWTKKSATCLGPRPVACPVQAWFTQLVKATQGIKQSASPWGPSRPGRKPPVPPKPCLTPSTRKRLKFTPEVSSAELAQELPFSDEPGTGPWDTPSERVKSIKKSFKRSIRNKAAVAAKKKAESLAKKALDWTTWKTRDGTDPETPCCAPIPTEVTTLATRGQVI